MDLSVFTTLGISPGASGVTAAGGEGRVCKPSPAYCTAHCRLNMAVGCFRSPVRRSGTRCLTSSEIRRVVLTVLTSFLRRSCLVFTNVTSALEVF